MSEQSEQWATVDLMGHAQTAGRISMENGLLRVDVPIGDNYRTEFYGLAAIYSIRIVSEQIARAYGHASHAVVAYDTPIVTREQHQAVVSRLENEQSRLRDQVRELERRLTKINALPAPRIKHDDGAEDIEEDDDIDEDDRERCIFCGSQNPDGYCDSSPDGAHHMPSD